MSVSQQRVLLRWIPTEALRARRRLTLSPKWASPVQQKAVKAAIDPELFALAYVKATYPGEGYPYINVGFSSDTPLVYTDQWDFAKGARPEITHTWNEEPTVGQLLAEIFLTPEEQSQAGQIVAQIKAEQAALADKAAKDLIKEKRSVEYTNAASGRDSTYDADYLEAKAIEREMRAKGEW